MSLTRWFRKNNTKIMAIVVIVLMVGFIGGSYIQQLNQQKSGRGKTVASFGDDSAITNQDIALARREIEILKMLKADMLLKIVTVPIFRTQDLRSIMLGELLFSERKDSPELIRGIKQLIRSNDYRISDKQINDIYRRSMGSEIYWLLLSKEAEQAGIRVSQDGAGEQLAKAIPQLFNGATYQQLMGSLIGRQGISEQEALAAFSKLLSVLEYGRMITLSENVTTAEMMYAVSWESEAIDFNVVKINSAAFVESQEEPTEKEISAHFAKYKKYFDGSTSDENPYGFGYKQPDMLRLEYIALKVDDVSKTVLAPTQEEMEEYYQRYRSQLFTEQIPSDPNDPNSQATERVKSYAEVAGDISNGILQRKTGMEVGRILQKVRSVTEAGLQDTYTEPSKMSTEEFRKLMGDYKTAAEEISNKNNIKLYTGETGFLGAGDMQMDTILGGLYVGGYGYNPVQLTGVVFAVDELGASELGPFDVPKPRLYENIGPVQDMFGQIVMIMRITAVRKASEPEDINQSISKSTIAVAEGEITATDDVYTVKDKVIDSLKELAAMETAKIKAEEFIKLAKKDGWEKTSDKFVKLYGEIVKETPGGTDAFVLQNAKMCRVPEMTLERYIMQNEGNPAGREIVEGMRKEMLFLDMLYGLVPKGAETIETLPMVLEFKPAMSYYCLKDVSILRVDRNQYEQIKGIQTYKQDFVKSQSLSVVHFNPENIIKRTRFRIVAEETVAEPNTPMKIEG